MQAAAALASDCDDLGLQFVVLGHAKDCTTASKECLEGDATVHVTAGMVAGCQAWQQLQQAVTDSKVDATATACTCSSTLCLSYAPYTLCGEVVRNACVNLGVDPATITPALVRLTAPKTATAKTTSTAAATPSTALLELAALPKGDLLHSTSLEKAGIKSGDVICMLQQTES